MLAHVHTHTHTCTHTYTHTHMLAHVHTHTYTHTHTHTHIPHQTHKHWFKYIHTYIHTYIHKYNGRRVDAVLADTRREEDAEAPMQERDWEEYDHMEEGQARMLETSYPMLNFGVLLRIERLDPKDAEEDAWARLLE
jgi:hypothetical protein